jgi:hypothetical protein
MYEQPLKRSEVATWKAILDVTALLLRGELFCSWELLDPRRWLWEFLVSHFSQLPLVLLPFLAVLFPKMR